MTTCSKFHSRDNEISLMSHFPVGFVYFRFKLVLVSYKQVFLCVFFAGVGFELVPIFEHHKNEEFGERKEKRKKMDDEDNNKKANTSNGETENKKLYDGMKV